MKTMSVSGSETLAGHSDASASTSSSLPGSSSISMTDTFSSHHESSGLHEFVFRTCAACRWLRSLSVDLRVLTFTVMMAVAVVPIMLFYNWVERSSLEKEIAHVKENHLIIAENLSTTLSRYVGDAKTTFNLAVEKREIDKDTSGFEAALASFNLCHIVVLDSHNQVKSRIEGHSSHPRGLPSAANIAHIRKLASMADGEVVISGIRNHSGTPHFFMARQLKDGSLAIAPWGPRYLREIQKSIAFGERGHAMIVDQNGLVVAHPNAEWQRISKDASKLSVVQAMIKGKTGVMQFWSPPMKAQMIAGHTQVPETGWGVMVPQPISELQDRAQVVQEAAIILALFAISLVAFVSLWFSNMLGQPIQAIGRAAQKVSSGSFNERVTGLSKSTPGEIQNLANDFNAMVDDIQVKNMRLQQALQQAEQVSHERAELLDAARRAGEVKSQFVSMVSHELRTPLTSIKGSLDLINSGLVEDLPPKTKSLIAIAAKNSDQLSSLINDLLDLDKLDAGKIRYEFANIDLHSLLKDAAQAIAGYGHLSNVTFWLDNDLPNVSISGDYNRLMQVMANLLSNAAKFSPSGSHVDISMATDEDKVRITVQDYGFGMPASAKDSIFEKFVQLDSSNARAANGSGLGLPIARLIAEGHGGSLTYETTESKGTAFFLDLPLNA